jgi:aminobenzoyl-glutamate transport protein
MLITPGSLLTPMMVFLGIMSSIAMDAGYVVLPPLAALLYKAVGRSPLAGIAAVFAGVSAGFNANLFVTGLDPMLAEFTNQGARLVDPGYQVAATANWAFMIGSTFMATFVGWGVSHFLVEPRLEKKPAEDGGPTHVTEDDVKAAQHIEDKERRGLGWALTAFVSTIAAFACLILIPGAPLNGKVDITPAQQDAARQAVLDRAGQPLVDLSVYEASLADVIESAEAGEVPRGEITAELESALAGAEVELPPGVVAEIDAALERQRSGAFDRWIEVIEPLILLVFIVPGLAYGISVGTIKDSKDAAKLMVEAMAAMAPIIVLAFFAGQFIAYFEHSRLGTMLAMSGGAWLSELDMATGVLLIVFILVTALFNLFVGSMSAKYALFAPIFVPMFMLLGISPELTQATYRIGDSVSNIITPLNSYLVIILVFMQKYAPKSGIGTLISMMLPYTIVFTVAWSLMLLLWLHFDLPVGLPPATGPTEYIPSGG